MKGLLPPLVLGVLLTLAGCRAAPGPTAPPTALPTALPTASPTVLPSVTPAPVPAAAPVWGIQESGDTQYALDAPTAAVVTCTFALPYIENGAERPSYAAINDYYATLGRDLITDMQTMTAQARDDYAASKALGDAFDPYSAEETYEVKGQTDTRVSILRTHYGHIGGPYPSLLYMADHFDLTTGRQLFFADFFTDPAEAEARILAEVLRQGADHAEYDGAALKTAFRREQFYMTQEGLVFFYQPETLAPHAAGLPLFAVPSALLEGLVIPWS